MSYDKKNSRSINTTLNGEKVRITAEFGMTYTPGNQSPYFGVTGEVRKLTLRGTPYRGERGVVSCGAIGDIIAKRFNRELSRACRWHLCDQQGQPMHYVANAMYWVDMLLGNYEQRAWDPDPIEAFARHIVLGARDSEVWLNNLSPEERREEIKRLMTGDTRAQVESWLEMRLPELRAAFEADMASIGVEFISEKEMASENARVRSLAGRACYAR